MNSNTATNGNRKLLIPSAILRVELILLLETLRRIYKPRNTSLKLQDSNRITLLLTELAGFLRKFLMVTTTKSKIIWILDIEIIEYNE